MKNINKLKKPCQLTAMAMLILFTVFMAANIQADDEFNTQVNDNLNEENSPPLPVKEVTIDIKSLEDVTTTTGESYVVSDETIIAGLDSKQVSIRKMLVPCDARITYKVKNNVAIAQLIKITRIHSDANWHWIVKYPE
ncbi:MAG: hypothetical protein GY874_03320 [Desulfobacteraceae bacterium]|nr:hypothetical protein [Desulfobacteraceae bacterium]